MNAAEDDGEDGEDEPDEDEPDKDVAAGVDTTADGVGEASGAEAASGCDTSDRAGESWANAKPLRIKALKTILGKERINASPSFY